MTIQNCLTATLHAGGRVGQSKIACMLSFGSDELFLIVFVSCCLFEPEISPQHVCCCDGIQTPAVPATQNPSLSVEKGRVSTANLVLKADGPPNQNQHGGRLPFSSSPVEKTTTDDEAEPAFCC